MKLLAAVVAAIAASSSLAVAQPRHTRDAGAPPPPAARAAPTPPAPTPAKPGVTAETLLQFQQKALPIRKGQIEILDDLIADCEASSCDPMDLADYHFRKAELYALEQRYYRLTAQGLAIAADRARTPADKKKLLAKSATVAENAKRSLLAAVKVYRAMTADDRFRNYQNMPQALFYFGYMLGSGGYPKDMRAVYDRLLKDYPSSPYVPTAHLAFADYHFEQGQLADAENRYKRVLQFPKASVYWYAKYMLGWVHLNRGEHQQALELFHAVAIATRGDRDREVLHRASLKDVVRAYAEVGNTGRAHDYFKKLDQPAAFWMYELLADLLREHGKAEKAIYVYRDLIGIAPTNRRVCLWQHGVADVMLGTSAGNTAKLDEIDNLVKLYAALARGKTLPAADLAECKDLAAGMAGDLARAWHSEWSKTYDTATYALADRAYRIYLGTFTGAPDYGSTQFYRAELLWSRADRERDARKASVLWENAAAAFVDVVDTGKVGAKLADESARAIVLAMINARGADPRPPQVGADPKPKSGGVPVPHQIPDRDKKILAAFELYAKKVRDKNSAEAVEVKMHHGALLARHDHLAEAIPLFEAIVADHRGSKFAEDAVNFVLDAYNRLDRHAELVARARQILADKKFLADKPELERRLVAIEVTAARKDAERIEADARKTGNLAKLVECGEAYTRLYNRDTEADGADELLYNAAVCFEDGKSVGQALEMYKLLESMGDDAREDIRARAVARMGVAYGRVAYYHLASKYLELYFAKYAGVKGNNEARRPLVDARAAISDAVVYRKGLGDDDKAIENSLRYVAHRDTKPAEKAEAFFNLHAIYDKQGDVDRIVRHLREYVSRHGDAGGTDRLIQAHARIGLALWSSSCPSELVDGSCVKTSRIQVLDTRRRRGKRSYARQQQCGPGTKITVVDRDATRARAAQAAFGKAIAAYESRAGTISGDRRAATYWYAVAKLHALEPRYEAYLDLAFPTGLDFDPKNRSVAAKSLARFERWLADKDAAAKQLASDYNAVVAIKDAPNAIVAAARVGQVAQNASDALFTAEIPSNIRPYQEAVELYCDTLTAKTDALEALTVDAYTACLGTSTRLGWFSEWSRLCERELGVLQPGRYPQTTERRAAPTRAAMVTDVEPLATVP
jgi:tetratricopeptide (TPR) repeat protein